MYFRRQKSGKVYVLITIVITLYIHTSCSRHSEPENTPPAKPSIPVLETLAKAEDLFKQREDINNLREARRLTGQLRDPDSRNFEVEWKYAKYSLFLGQRLEDETEKEKVLEQGRDSGSIAMRMQPDKPDGYFWFGANLGELSKMSPITVGLKSVDDVQGAMNKVIEMQPGYQGASAYDILAQVEMGTRVFGNGKAERAVEYLEKGLALQPDNSNIRLHLAQAYLAVKKDDLAKQQLQYILKMPPPPDYLPEHKLVVEQAKKMLSGRF